jgi:hypothetical protein
MTPKQANAFVKANGVVLESGRGAVPSLAESMAIRCMKPRAEKRMRFRVTAAIIGRFSAFRERVGLATRCVHKAPQAD